ncbi:MAG: acetyl-CoA carboxylase carboxyltransferase subunit beta [Acidimicrobiales bacterium]|nr:acetyl-CoA carboxylase carboxyltransferase subunit beta [Hyphomonadaceae bacterium]RZV43929.1 MAG: acetyl-CoA carboxylase carboxyltransferase subunit beta [Acidimicrobiales bacterium]
MNWITKLTPPGVKKIFTKRDTPDNLWVKCPKSGEMVFHTDLENNLHVTPSGHHMRIGPDFRFAYTFDDGKHKLLETPDVVSDPLKFKDDKKYTDRLKAARSKTGMKDAMAMAVGKIEGIETLVLVQNFAFMGGSLGMAAGDAFLSACEKAVSRKIPLVIFTAAGGARMQEGALSLMQMPRTTIGVQKMREAGMPYIVVLTDPTTGGVTASYAMLGDVHLAEPDALICFAGPRVIEQTIREKLPEGFQRSEYLQAKGMIDKVVHRKNMRSTLGKILGTLTQKKRVPSKTPALIAPDA